jgi:hypothetical protein
LRPGFGEIYDPDLDLDPDLDHHDPDPDLDLDPDLDDPDPDHDPDLDLDPDLDHEFSHPIRATAAFIYFTARISPLGDMEIKAPRPMMILSPCLYGSDSFAGEPFMNSLNRPVSGIQQTSSKANSFSPTHIRRPV